MPFSGAGRINAVSKRGLGAEIIAVPTDQSLNSNEDVFNVYQSLPGTGVLTNTAGPRPYFIPYQSNQFKSVVSPSGTYLVTIASSYPFAVIYKKVNGLWTLLNGNIAASYSSIISAAWSPDESTLVLITNTSTIYVFTRSGDTFTYNNNFSLGYASNMCAYDQTGQYFGVVSNSTPYITIYSVSGTTFTKLSNPATLPTNAAYYLSWSSANNLLAVGGAGSPPINVYSYSGSGTGTVFTKLVNPGTLPGSNVNTLAFNNTASGAISTASLAVGPNSGLPIVYNLNLAGTLTSFVNTVTLAANFGGCNEVTWNSDGTSLFFAGGNSPILFGFNRTGVNTYTTISNIISTATATGGFSNATGAGVIWNTNTNHLISISDSIPGITELSRSGNTFTDVDCWGRNAQGYNIQSYVISNNAETIGRWNPGGSNYAGTILATSQASTLVPFYYNNNGGGQGTYTQIVTTFTATSVGTILDMAWSPNGQILSVYGLTSPYIANYYVTGVGTSTTFTKLSTPTGLIPTPPGSNGYGQLAWSPDSSILVLSGSSIAPYIGWYAVTGTGLSTTFTQGTYTQFSSTLTSAINGAAFNPDGSVLSIGGGGGGIPIKFYNVSYNGTATTFSNSGVSITFIPSVTRITWSPNGNYIATSNNSSASATALRVIQRTGNTYKDVSPTVSSLNATLSQPVWSADSSRVYCFVEGTGAMAATQYPGISMLTRSNSTTTWVYTTATSVNIDYPTQSYYNIDIKYDY